MIEGRPKTDTESQIGEDLRSFRLFRKNRGPTVGPLIPKLGMKILCIKLILFTSFLHFVQFKKTKVKGKVKGEVLLLLLVVVAWKMSQRVPNTTKGKLTQQWIVETSLGHDAIALDDNKGKGKVIIIMRLNELIFFE